MQVVLVSPEVWPFTRVGGLSEVAHDLPCALARQGLGVSVISPKHRIPPELGHRLEKLDLTMEVPVSWRIHRAEVYRCQICPGVENYLVGCDSLFDRDGVYGNAYGDYEDNAERFIFFSRAVLDLIKTLGWRVDILHCHDWTTGLIPIYLRSLYADEPLLRRVASLLTVHNLSAQGSFWHYDMPLTGLGWEYFNPEAIEFYGKINFLKAGLMYADLVNTVSQTYAQEILEPEMGLGLDGVLRRRRERLRAVTNGVDFSRWDPHLDPVLVQGFDAQHLEGRRECAVHLRRIMGLRESQRPLAAMLGRLSERRGLDLLLEALPAILERDVDLVVMGFGESHYQAALSDAQAAHAGRVGWFLGYEMDLAHKILAGTDFLLMPSRFEPCGLHQLQAQRYGTVPVVRATGGLVETVVDHTPQQPGTGFHFHEYRAEAMVEALDRALAAHAQPEVWRGIVTRGMAHPFSWDRAAASYHQLYQEALTLRGQAGETQP